MSYIDTKKKWNRIVACVMAVILSTSMTISPLAAEAVPNTPKEEVVYVNLNTDGSVKEINVVNIFDLDKDGQIVDYGSYESLRNMTTTDKIEYSGDKITVDAKAGKLYYEGKLSKNVMPWDFSLHYYLDGKEYPAEEIAGKLDAVSVSLNAPTARKYLKLCHPDYGIGAFEAILDFTREIKQYMDDVTMSVVSSSISREDIEECRKIAGGLSVKFRVR